MHRDAAPDERAAIVDRARERRFRRVLGHGRASASARARGAARVEGPRDGDVRREPSVAPAAVAARRRRVERTSRAGKGDADGGRRQRDQESPDLHASLVSLRAATPSTVLPAAAARRRMAAATSRTLLGPSSERPSASTPTASPGRAASRGLPVGCGALARCCWAVAFGFRAGAAVRAACFEAGAALTRGRTAAATGRGVVDGVELGGGEVEARVVAGRSSTDRFVAVRDVEVVVAFLDTRRGRDDGRVGCRHCLRRGRPCLPRRRRGSRGRLRTRGAEGDRRVIRSGHRYPFGRKRDRAGTRARARSRTRRARRARAAETMSAWAPRPSLSKPHRTLVGDRVSIRRGAGHRPSGARPLRLPR